MYGTFDLNTNKQKNAEAERIMQERLHLNGLRPGQMAAVAGTAALPTSNSVQPADSYQGHSSDGSSIQKHSLGDDYPYVLVGTGDDQWYYQGPNGEQFSDKAPTVKEARIKLYQRRLLHVMHS